LGNRFESNWSKARAKRLLKENNSLKANLTESTKKELEKLSKPKKRYEPKI
jgi:hypothetical protein